MTESVSAPGDVIAQSQTPRRWWVERLSRIPGVARPLPACLALACFVHVALLPEADVPATRNLSVALGEMLKVEGLEVSAREIAWLDPIPGSLATHFSEQTALFSAHKGDEPSDIYRAEVRLSPEGRLLEVTAIHNLTETSAVEEQQLVVAGQLAAWAIADGNRFYSVQLADFGGESIPRNNGWSWLKRTQRRLANLQATGSLDGVGRRSFKLTPAPSKLVLGFAEGKLLLDADAHHMQIAADTPGDKLSLRFAVEQPHHLARPGNLVTWAVDRVRAAPWFGKDKMQWVKAIGFAGLDYFERFMGTVTGSDGSEEIAEELGELARAKPVEYTDPETGWPPPPMKPLLKTPLEGEGKWVSLKDDPYIAKNAGAPSPFMFSFIRTDHKRSFSQTYVVLWDPRQVELHAASGTQEPKTATGETGDGMVPRKVGVIDRMLAGFNGGFQATHGEFGMMAEGVVYLPPKPYSATVAKLDDGWTAFGTWPNDDDVPANIVSFRQNMTPLIQDGEVNPYKRSWWGGTPPGWEDESRTIRSALCLTKEKFVAYIYGSSIDAEHLITAAKAARCDYAIHLDMNPGHTGLEFYRVAPAGQLPKLTDKLDSRWQARGKVVEMPGWEYMGRRMIKFMALMNFPRYINRESRDFFYLTLRHILPGPALPEHFRAPEGWQTKGLPQHGWPLAIARATITPDPNRPNAVLELVKLDGRMLKLGKGKAAKQTVITLNGAERSAPRGLWWTPAGFNIAGRDDKQLMQQRGTGTAHLVATGIAPNEAPGKVVTAAAGVDAGGMAIYLELMSGHERATDARLMASVLSGLGCSDVVLFEASLSPAIGGERTLDGRAASAEGQPQTRFVRGEAPAARRFLEATDIVAPDVWAPLQRKRVRYFRKPSRGTESGSEANASATEPAPESNPPAPQDASTPY